VTLDTSFLLGPKDGQRGAFERAVEMYDAGSSSAYRYRSCGNSTDKQGECLDHL
jgi:hypothetical protein